MVDNTLEAVEIDNTIKASTRYPITVLEEGSWKLNRQVEDEERYDNRYYFNSMLIHECPQAESGLSGSRGSKIVTMNGRDHSCCYICKDPVPDSIQAVWILHNVRF